MVSHAETHSEDGAQRALMINDARRAYFYAKIQRDVYVELPKEDEQHGTGMLGKLRLCLCGTRDFAKGLQETLSAHLIGLGFHRGEGHHAFSAMRAGALRPWCMGTITSQQVPMPT